MSENLKAASKRKRSRRPSPAIGSALACRIADQLLTDWLDRKGTRLQLRGPNEEDYGGLCRESVIKVIDKELDADALRRSKPALVRKIRRILKAPNGRDAVNPARKSKTMKSQTDSQPAGAPPGPRRWAEKTINTFIPKIQIASRMMPNND